MTETEITLFTQLPKEYQEHFEAFVCKMMDVRTEARNNLQKAQDDYFAEPENKYDIWLVSNKVECLGLTSACSDAEVYAWCLNLWNLDCHHPCPPDGEEFCLVCKKPYSEIIDG